MSKKFKRRLYIVGIGLLAYGIYFILPTGMPKGKNYFQAVGERVLQKDEIGQFNYVYDTYEHLSFTGDEFHGWDEDEQLLWRYGIAFGAYAMPSIAMISEEHKNSAAHCLKLMIGKMKSRKVWGDWLDYGLSDDPISEGNIMYKGHLNLMYGLYQMMTGDTTFAREYTWMTNGIVDEMRRHHVEGKHEGADCEPGRYFPQCNSISLLSLKIYDQLYGTNYTDVESQWTVDFIKEKMTDERTGLYLKMYNTDMNFCKPYLSGYTNAWSMCFLRVVDPEYNDELYETWKQTFVKQYGPYAIVKEDPEAGPSPLAHMNGLIVAKEYGDVKLFTKLRNSLDRKLYKASDRNYYLYDGVNNAIYNGPLLWTKVHVGWDNILNHDWQHGTFDIPEVDDMIWTDILEVDLLVRED
ncbi:MAG: hypothetical protein AAF598_08230 [Bacteroidota bacterium]